MKIYDVFISYRRTNEDVTKRKEGYGGSEIAEALYRYLTAKGLRVFYDKIEMPDGHYFWDSIADAIKVAPHYILVGSTDAFIYRDVDEENGERDYVKDEIELAVAEYEKNKIERTVTVIQTVGANIPEINTLPENVRNITKAQRKILQYGSDNPEVFYEIFKSVTNVNRRNLWFAAHRWLENSKQPGGRFASLNINESILPNASKNKTEQKAMPINVYNKDNVSENRQSLLDAMGSNSNHLYLIGQGGIGKTTALMHIMNNAYVDKQYSEKAQIPLFVELSFAPDTYGALYEGGKSTFIRRSIYKQVRADRTIKQVTTKEVSDVDEVFSTLPYDVAVQPITDILSKTTPAPEYLLLLDGLNEVSSVTIEETGLSVVQMIMREIDLLISECPNVRVVLTSRSDESAIYNESISRLFLSGVEDSTIKDYLESFELSKEQIDKVLEDENLYETLQIPLFLTMYASLSKYDEVSTQGEILKLFFNERRKNISVYTMQERLSQVEKNITDVASAVQKNRIDADMQNFILDFILPEIAWSLERNGEFYLSVRSIRKIVEPILTDTDDLAVCGEFSREIFSKYRNGASAKMHTYKIAKRILERLGDDITEVAESIVNCCVFAFGIMQESNGKYGFIHQHIRDYFAALKNINIIRLAVYLYEEGEKELALECMNKTFKDEPVNYTVRRFMGEYLGEHRNKPYYANEKWNYGVPTEKCDRNLIKRTLDIYRGYFDGECGYGVYSFVEILKSIRKDLSGSDFSYLSFELCRFEDVILGNKDFGADFEGSVISSENLFIDHHVNDICCSNFAPDGKTFLTVAIDGIIKIWDSNTLNPIITLCAKRKNDRFYGKCVAMFSPDGKYICSGAIDGTFRIWEIKDLLCIVDLNFNEPIENININCFSNIIAITTGSAANNIPEKNTIFFNVNNRKQIAKVKGIGNGIFLKDGKTFMGVKDKYSIEDGELQYQLQVRKLENLKDIKKIDVVSERKTSRGFFEKNDEVVLSNNGKYMATLSLSGYIRIWNAETLDLMGGLKGHIKRVLSASFSCDGKYLVTVSLDDTIRIWSIAKMNCIWQIKTEGIRRVSVVFNPTKNVIAVSSSSQESCYVNFFDINTQKCVGKIKGKRYRLNDIQYIPNRNQIATASSDGLVRIWDLFHNISVETLVVSKNDVKAICFNPAGDNLITVSSNGCSKLWSTITWHPVLEFAKINSAEKGDVFSPSFSPDGANLIAQNLEYETLLYDTKSYDPILKLGKWNSVACYNTTGEYFVKAGFGAMVFDTKKWDLIFKVKYKHKVKDVFFGRTKLYIVIENNIEIFDIVTKEKVGIIYGNRDGQIAKIKLNNKETYIVTTGCTLKVWDSNTFECVGEIKEYCEKAIYNSNDTIIATINGEQIKFWDANNFANISSIYIPSGMIIHNVNFANLNKISNLSLKDKKRLRQGGASID